MRKKVSREMKARSNPVEIPLAPAGDELDQLIQWRRMFHSYPEIRWTEFWTTAKIIEILEGFGFDVLYGKQLYTLIEEQGVDPLALRKIVPPAEVMEQSYRQAVDLLGSERIIESIQGGLTGVVGRISGRKGMLGSEGGNRDAEPTKREPTFGFRIDIDGLPLKESDEPDHFPSREGFASTNGNMHACGHDGHIAIGLGLAKKISENIDSLGGEYWIIFQPGEEGGMGGEVFSHLQFLKELDHFIAVHLGLMGGRKLSCGLVFMDANAYSVEFRGRSTHSAVAPHEGKNALLAACTAVTNLYAIPRHGEGASRVNVGEFHSDNAMNVISDKAVFTYQSRGENPEIADYMDRQAARIIEAAARMYDVEVEIRREGKYVSAPNDPGMRDAVRSTALGLGMNEKAIIPEFRLPGSEDAPYLMKAVQAGRGRGGEWGGGGEGKGEWRGEENSAEGKRTECIEEGEKGVISGGEGRAGERGGEATYIGLGCNTRGGHHSPTFDIDEDLLMWGVDILYGIVQMKNEGIVRNNGTLKGDERKMSVRRKEMKEIGHKATERT